MPCCTDPTILFAITFTGAISAVVVPADGAPLSAYFDDLGAGEMSRPLASPLDACLNPRLDFAIGVVRLLD